MTKTIVVPLDGSEESQRALPVAGWLADRLGATLHLITTSFEQDLTEDQAYLEAQAATCRRADVDTTVLPFVLPTPGILETVDGLPDAALCMTTRGRGRLSKAVLGSVADEVLRETTSPVVLVGPSCRTDRLSATEVLVCLDGSHGSTAVLPVVGEWADQLGLAVHLLTVEAPGVLDDATNTWPQELLDSASSHLEAIGVPAEEHAFESNHPGDVVLAFAAARDAALIALGTRGKGAASAALGGVATHVVRHSQIPVLIHR